MVCRLPKRCDSILIFGQFPSSLSQDMIQPNTG